MSHVALSLVPMHVPLTEDLAVSHQNTHNNNNAPKHIDHRPSTACSQSPHALLLLAVSVGQGKKTGKEKTDSLSFLT